MAGEAAALARTAAPLPLTTRREDLYMDAPIARRAATVLVLALVSSLAVVASPAAATEVPSDPALELSAHELQQLRSFLN